MASPRSAAGRIASACLALALLVLIAYFALKAIPGAERPTLQRPTQHAHSR